MIARLADGISGPGELMPNPVVRSRMLSEWRSDLFYFRAFKVAAKKLLDALDEPPAEKDFLERRGQFHGNLRKELVETIGADFTKMFEEIRKSPESYGAWVLGNLWARFFRSDLPFTEDERRMMLKHPILGRAMEREYYGFQKARKALELKPPKEDRNLSENDGVPADIEEAIKFISDEARKLLENPKDKADD